MNETMTYKERMAALRCAVIMPTYNNAGTIAKVISDVKEFSDDVIVVNDGSTDETSSILASIFPVVLSSFDCSVLVVSAPIPLFDTLFLLLLNRLNNKALEILAIKPPIKTSIFLSFSFIVTLITFVFTNKILCYIATNV